MGNDVQAPLLEVAHLVLRLADDDLDDCAFHPLGLPAQLLQQLAKPLSVVGVRGFRPFRLFLQDQAFHLSELRLPPRLDALEHSSASHLIDAHHHGLARLPAGRAVLNHILRQLVQPIVGRDHLVVLPEQLLQ